MINSDSIEFTSSGRQSSVHYVMHKSAVECTNYLKETHEFASGIINFTLKCEFRFLGGGRVRLSGGARARPKLGHFVNVITVLI